MTDSDIRRFYDAHHADAVVVLNAQDGQGIVMATEGEGDVTLTPESALKLSRDLARRARAAMKTQG